MAGSIALAPVAREPWRPPFVISVFAGMPSGRSCIIFEDGAFAPILTSMRWIAAHLSTNGLAPTGPCRAADLGGSPAAPPS